MAPKKETSEKKKNTTKKAKPEPKATEAGPVTEAPKDEEGPKDEEIVVEDADVVKEEEVDPVDPIFSDMMKPSGDDAVTFCRLCDEFLYFRDKVSKNPIAADVNAATKLLKTIFAFPIENDLTDPNAFYDMTVKLFKEFPEKMMDLPYTTARFYNLFDEISAERAITTLNVVEAIVRKQVNKMEIRIDPKTITARAGDRYMPLQKWLRTKMK